MKPIHRHHPLTAALALGALSISAAAAQETTGAAPPPQEQEGATRTQEGTEGAAPQGEDPSAPRRPTPVDAGPVDAGPVDAGPQEGDEDETDLRSLNPFAPNGGPGGPENIEQLFLRVEKRLQRVTDLLYEASSGDVSGAEEIGSAGIDDLIREAERGAAGASSGMARLLGATRGQSEATLDDIQRILEMAEQQNSSSSSSSSSSGGSSGSQSSSGQSTPQQGQTPSGSQKQEGERAPQPGEGQQDQQGEPQGNEQPRGNQESDAGQDGRSAPPAEGETGGPSGASGNEEWGDLPVHLRKVFQNGVSEDVPPRYRDWVDSYYKRLNRGNRR